MSPLLLQKLFPGATTCILIGQPDAGLAADLGRYRHTLWFTDAVSAQPASTKPKSPSTQRVLVETAPAEELAPLLARFLGHNQRRLPSLYVTPTVLERCQPAYEAAITGVHAFLEHQHQARVTRQKDGFTWQKHLFQNTAAYVRRRVPSAWAGTLQGLPAFVCGAGPSLDVSAPRLAPAARCGIVFAADSALRTLARHDLPVDFAVSIDAAKVPAKCLPPASLPSRVILTTVSPPGWCDALPEDRWRFVSSNQITEDWLGAHGVPRTEIPARENCGATALELARFLGCSPIYLFGLDLAVDAASPAQRHASGADASLYTASGYDPTQQLPTVPGNYAAQVPTFAMGDWQALDARLADWPAGLVSNVTDRGARFRNTTLVPPGEFTLADHPVDKPAALALLAVNDSGAPAAAAGALSLLRDTGNRAAHLVDPLRSALRKKGPPAVAQRFREFLAGPDAGAIFGAFSFKLMPHLLPPVEGDADFWQSLIEEFGALANAAAQVPPV